MTIPVWGIFVFLLVAIPVIWILLRSRIRVLKDQRQKFAKEINQKTKSLLLEIEKGKETTEILRRRIQELATLNEIGRALSSAIDINELIELIYNQTVRIMEVSAFYIALYDSTGNELQVIFDVLNGHRQHEEEITRKFANGRTEYIIRTQKPLLIKSDPQETYQALGIVTGDKKAKACAGVPLIYAGKAIGALVVQSYNYDHVYHEDHINLLTTIANQAAIAIENARLFQHLQDELKERKKIEERLQQRNADLVTAKKDTDNILNNVKDGLFLIDRDYKIASQYSATLEEIFARKSLAGINIIDYLRDKIEEKVLHAFNDYLNLLFDYRVEETTLENLNPLTETKLLLKDENNKPQSKYLTFEFRRIQTDKRINEIIVSANDITHEVELAKNLEKTQEQSKRQMEWLFAILNLDGQMLDEFMRSSDEELSHIQKRVIPDLNLSALDEIYRSVHSIKGNASMLELDFIARKAHNIEELLSRLRTPHEQETDTAIAVHSEFTKFLEMFTEIRGLIERLHQFHTRFRPTRKHETELLFNSLLNLVKRISTQHNKEVNLDYSGYNASIVPHRHRLLIRDILVQLVRNSVYHGIEAVEERLSRKKDRQGHIYISDALDDKCFLLKYQDDGRGIQTEQLRAAALKSGKTTDSEIKNWSEKQLAELIFQPGISTTEIADLSAGRGMGMNIIKDKVEKISGSIELNYETGLYTQFIIRMPGSGE
jgi:GAF domain-containing protein/HPt (histidine-containing phosphotransfer) domain-containing protein